MSPEDLESKLNDLPFQPFRIKLSTNSTIDVFDPGEIILGSSSASFPLEVNLDTEGFRNVKTWRKVALAHMVEFIDIDPPKSSSRQKRN